MAIAQRRPVQTPATEGPRAKSLRPFERVGAPSLRPQTLEALAACEEVVFRGAITLFLEERFGSDRAPWVASGLYVLAMIPSLRPSVLVAAIAISLSTAFLVARFRRVTPALVAHAVFGWLAVEFVLPNLWHYLLTHPR